MSKYLVTFQWEEFKWDSLHSINYYRQKVFNRTCDFKNDLPTTEEIDKCRTYEDFDGYEKRTRQYTILNMQKLAD